MTYNVSCVNSSTGAVATPEEGSTNSQVGVGVVLTKPNCSSNCTVRCDPLWSTEIIKVGSAPVIFGNDSADANGAVQDGVCSYGSPGGVSSTCAVQACSTTSTPPPTSNCTVTDGGGTYIPPPECSPIIIDTTGKGFALTSAANGVMFNFSGSGPIQTAWTAASSGNAFLCLPDPNGRCDDAADLFGNFTPQPPSSNPNGFAALAVYDLPANGGNGDGVIDARDAIFASLRLWIDANHDGISQPEELFTLPSLGVNSISLNYQLSQRTDQYGNVFRYRSVVNPNSPNSSVAYDVFFVNVPPTAASAMLAAPASNACKVAPAKVPPEAGAKSKK